ncbi:TetR/AcrR family transcriptional regulator [Mycetocola tolaasinivorans]|uniref:TetR/AcrR family transcriptional regulator n=1 Tax=Mycetocola tolaasinivorans TaxID=76635 RepID=A0A3L7AEB8_9MICO|nr:TetR/AcrR family transcriptional regulator [Mycetocola tolaasinivorans]RLP77991.1 TetR/AcrR family transcriptional regulator [Mycetocola tolaasinivorans]
MAATVGLTLDHVTAVAADLADRAGFDRVTVSALARELGVKPASLYAHVRGLDALREIIGTRAHTVLADSLEARLSGLTALPALSVLAEVMRAFAHEHPGLWQASRATSTGDDYVAAARRVSSEVAEVCRGYGVPEPEITHAVRIVGSSLGGFIGLDDAGGFSASNPDAAVSWRRLISVLDHALTRWPTDSDSTDSNSTEEPR